MAATVLFDPAYTGVIQYPGYVNTYDKSMDKYLEVSARVPLVNGQFFTEDEVDNMTPKLGTWNSELKTPGISEDTELLPMEQPAGGRSKEGEIDTLRVATRITRTMERIDRSGKIRQMAMAGLPNSGKRYMELKMANVFNTGTATEGADGSNIWANDHIHDDASGGTWSNYETAAALTSTTYNTMRVSMRKRTSTKGYVSPIVLKQLMVPPDLEEKARQIQSSNLKPENSLNQKNVWEGKFDIIVNDYLTDTNGWWGIGDLPEAMWGLHVAYLERFSVMSLPYPTADYPDIVAGWRLRGQVDVFASVAYNVHHNIGA